MNCVTSVLSRCARRPSAFVFSRHKAALASQPRTCARALKIGASDGIQFGRATPLGEGRFRLERLVRGRGATEWAASLHQAGELFALIEPETLQSVPLPPWVLGSCVSVASGRDPAVRAEILMTGENLRPGSPARIQARATGSGGLALDWLPRGCRASPWIDGVDGAMCDTGERYRVTIRGSASRQEIEVSEAALLLGRQDLECLGAGPAIVEVRQVGAWAVSRPSSIAINIVKDDE